MTIRGSLAQIERMNSVSTPTKGTKLPLLLLLLSISLAVLLPVANSSASPSRVFNIANGDVVGLIAAINNANAPAKIATSLKRRIEDDQEND